MNEDTPEFIARLIIREARAYLDSLPPPFSKHSHTMLLTALTHGIAQDILEA